MISITEWQKIGVGTTGFGIFFILFGMLLYFDSVLLAFGNLLFLTGLSFIIGLRRTFSFFFQRHKLKGTSFFLGGVVIVLLRWPLLGMFLETYGFFSLFSPLEGCPLGDKRTKAQRGWPCLNSHKEPAEDLTLIQGWTKSASGASADSVLAVLTRTACSSIEGEENHSHQRPQKCKWTSGSGGPRKGRGSARIQISIPCPHQPLCPQALWRVTILARVW
uniref:KiSS-1 metastasis suppressor n=1 Tax=Ovis aries TaxID=9940 RepID=A0AC11EM58_SHEEP